VEPIWSAAGTELFYRAGDKMLAVDVEQSPSFSFGKSHELFTGAYVFGSTDSQNYDVSRDGRRFLMFKRATEGTRSPINIIVNWFSELRARVPVKLSWSQGRLIGTVLMATRVGRNAAIILGCNASSVLLDDREQVALTDWNRLT